jgi:predicted transposase/invertase (TIGR01784 family)
MLMTEWNMDDALECRYEEGREEGLEEGIEKGIEEGIEKGREEGIEEGIEKVARNALAQGASLEFVQKITGLDIQTITSFR